MFSLFGIESTTLAHAATTIVSMQHDKQRVLLAAGPGQEWFHLRGLLWSCTTNRMAVDPMPPPTSTTMLPSASASQSNAIRHIRRPPAVFS